MLRIEKDGKTALCDPTQLAVMEAAGWKRVGAKQSPPAEKVKAEKPEPESEPENDDEDLLGLGDDTPDDNAPRRRRR